MAVENPAVAAARTSRKRVADTEFNLPEQRFGNFNHIGYGSFGVVIYAYDRVGRREVAVKKLTQLCTSEKTAENTYRELYCLKYIKHPNIIHFHEAFTPNQALEDFKELYFIMEYLGTDLRRLISERRLSHELLSFFLYQLLCAVNHLHRCKIVHRDLKPENVVVSENCTLKILDFGMSRRIETKEDDMLTAYVASRFYRAPEILVYRGYNESVDVWSIGCIFGELIVREILFEAKRLTAADQYEKVVEKMGFPTEEFTNLMTEDRKKTLVKLHNAFIQKGITGVSQPIEHMVPMSSFNNETEKPEIGMTSQNAIDLLKKMLVLTPERRITVRDALLDPYVYTWTRDEEVNAPIPDEECLKRISPTFKGKPTVEQWRELIFAEII